MEQFTDNQIINALYAATEELHDLSIVGDVDDADLITDRYGSWYYWLETEIIAVRTILKHLPRWFQDESMKQRAETFSKMIEHLFFEDYKTHDFADVETLEDWIMQHLDKVTDEKEDPWQECTFEDIRKGDLVKVENAEGLFQYDSPVKELSTVGDWLEIQHEGGMISSNRISTNVFYRIPKPVEYPNPDFHPVIFVPGREEGWVWDVNRYVCDSHGGHRDPQDFTDWVPARIIPVSVSYA